MIQQARKRLLIAALTFVLSGAMAVPVEAGVIPWAWDTLFGPVGSIRARRMCSTGYGIRNRCGYGPMSYGAMSYGSCGGGCSPCGGGSCGLSCGCGYGGYGSALSMGSCSSCASGQCGVNFFPQATPGNLNPVPSTPPAGTTPPGNRPPPTWDERGLNNSGSGLSGGTSINNNLNSSPRAAPEEFPTPPGESTIPSERRTPSPGRPSLPTDDDDGAGYHPAPINGLGGKVTWSSKSQIERQGGRTLGNRSVQITRQGSFPNSKWEAVSDTREVAKK